MEQEKIFKFGAYSIILLFLVNFWATKFHWYFSVWYFDMPMHFWGGVSVGLMAVWLFLKRNIVFSIKNILWLLSLVFVVGFLWEIFEVIFNNMIAGTSFDLLDTISDLFFDLLGGMSAFLFFKIGDYVCKTK